MSADRGDSLTDRRITAVLDSIRPKDWDAVVWTGNDYTTGRLDIADRKRLVTLVLAALKEAGYDVAAILAEISAWAYQQEHNDGSDRG